MRVLFLALGASRHVAVIEESRRLAEAGGHPVVLVDRPKQWADQPPPPGVEFEALVTIGADHWPTAAERMLLFRGPRFVLRRLAGRGTARADRVVSAYQRRIADPVHRRAFLPLYRRVWHGKRERPLDMLMRRHGRFDAVIVADARSFPAAQRVVERLAGSTGAPRVAFRVDQLLTPADGRADRAGTADREDTG
jgi:hypothetical protein